MSEHDVNDTASDAQLGTGEKGSLSQAAAGPPIDWDDAGSVAADARSNDPDYADGEGTDDDPLKSIYGPPAGQERVGD